jgi:hypothetical protein
MNTQIDSKQPKKAVIGFILDNLKLAIKINEVQYSIENMWKCVSDYGYEYSIILQTKTQQKMFSMTDRCMLGNGGSTRIFVVETKEIVYVLEFVCAHDNISNGLLLSLPVLEYFSKDVHIIKTEKTVEHIRIE